MRLTTGPYTVAGGGTVTIPLPAATLLAKAVIIGNLTPAPVTVTIAGQTSVLLPASANLYSLSSGSAPIVVTSLGTSNKGGTITAEWMTPATTPKSGYPISGAVTNLTLGADATVKVTGPVTIAGGTIDLAAGSVIGVSGGQLKAVSGQSLQPISTTLLPSDLGSGATGSVTLTANATLTRTVDYTTLAIDAGVVVSTGGYIIRCTGTASIEGTVANNGGASTSTRGGLGAPTAALAGGANGVSSYDLTTVKGTDAFPGACQGGAGGGVQVAGTTGAAGGIVTSYTPASPSFLTLHQSSLAGGASGAARSTTSTNYATTGGAGGAVLVMALLIRGAGTIEANAGVGLVNASKGGAGGSGGGFVMIASRTYNFTGTLRALGSAGILKTATGTVQAGVDGRTVTLIST